MGCRLRKSLQHGNKYLPRQATGVSNFLQDQLAEIKQKLEQSERDLIAYAQKEQIVNLDDKARVI